MNNNPESIPGRDFLDISPDELRRDGQDRSFMEISPDELKNTPVGGDIRGDLPTGRGMGSIGPESPENQNVALSEDLPDPGVLRGENGERSRNPIVNFGKTFWNVATKQIPAALSAASAAIGMTEVRGTDIVMPGRGVIDETPEEKENKRVELLNRASQGFEDFQQSQAGAITTTDQIGDSIDLINYVANSVGQAAAQIPASILSRGFTSMGQEVGMIYLDQVNKIAEKEGITPEEVIRQGKDNSASAVAYGVFAGALDFLGAKGATSIAPIGKFRNHIANRAMNMLRGASAEFATEGSQSIIEDFGSSRGAGDNVIEAISGVDLSNAVQEGLAGAVGGGGISAFLNSADMARQGARRSGLNADQTEQLSQELNIEPREGETAPSLNTDEIIVDGVDAANTSSSFSQDIRTSGLSAINKNGILNNTPEFDSVSDEVAERKTRAYGIRKPSLLSRITGRLSDVKKSFTRKYVNLDPVEDAVGIDVLRQYDALREYSEVVAYNSISNITRDLNKSEYTTFIDGLMLPDIVSDIEAGLYTNKSLPFGYKSLEQIQSDMEVAQQKIQENPNIQSALDKRRAFVDDLKQRLVDYDLLPEKVLDDDRYFHRQVTKYFNNQEYVGAGLSSIDIRTKERGFQKSRTGGGDFNTAYHEAEFEWVSQAIKQIGTVETLNRINSQYNIKESLEKQAEDISEEGSEVGWRDIIPEDHAIWKPEKGNYFYQALSIEDRVVDEVLSGQKELSKDDLRRVMAIGRSKDQWVIPDRVARTLDNFKEPPDQGPISKVARGLNTSWKQYILLNPIRVAKYNLNNTSGDMDIAIAYDPKIVTQEARSAARDLYRSLKGQSDLSIQKEMEELTRLGVVNSGLTVEEIPDLTKRGAFKSITNPGPNILRRYWNTVKDYTTMRENILRVAAFRRFKSRLESGEEGVYGASNPQQIEQIEDTNERAAKLARELIGDYGNISNAGQWLRQNMIPFYSWMEINAPRYYRMLKNLPHEGRGFKGKAAGLAFKKAGNVAVKGTAYWMKASALYSLISLWNHTMFPDEEEEFLQNSSQLHIILGRDADGSIRSIKFEGALGDALEWFDLADAGDDISKLVSGDKGFSDMMTEAMKGVANRVVNSSIPIPKTVIESLLGTSAYPDVFEPRTIRDPGEHASRLVSMDWLYNYVTNKPAPPGNPLERLVAYKTNPGEAAYYHTKRLAIDYLKDQGEDFPRMQPTERSNALYYYKQSVKWGERSKSRFWLKKYYELGGSREGIQRSIDQSAPLSSLNDQEQSRFIRSLSKEDREAVRRGQRWYRSVYRN